MSSRRSVLLIGRSQRVLADAVAGLRGRGYTAQATNDFADVTGRFDVQDIDLVVFGGQVPPDRNAELREEIRAINPSVVFVQGLAGIPGLIVDQVESAFVRDDNALAGAPTYAPDDRTIRLTLEVPAEVRVTAWWQTAFVPPDPTSDSLQLLDEQLAAGEHAICIPDPIPSRAAFATVQVGTAIYAFSITNDEVKGTESP